MLRWLTAGESHGEALIAILEGLPAGVKIQTQDVAGALARRRLGYGRGARMSFEQDQVKLLGGVRHGVSIGSPIAVQIGNTEWPKWQKVMSPDSIDAAELEELARSAPLTRPRPGHADLVGMQKYGFDDARPILERASARETAARVALGEFARRFLSQIGEIEIFSHVIRIGEAATPQEFIPQRGAGPIIDEDPVRCAEPVFSKRMQEEVEAAKKEGDTLGGIVEVLAFGLPPGLGSHVHADRRLDARLAGAVMGIQAIKGVEIGEGFEGASRRGSVAHDEMVTSDDGIKRLTARAGGTEGGMSTGEVLRVRAAMKPISTVPKALRTVDVSTGEAAKAINQRSDVCAVPAAGVIAEAVVSLVLADAVLEKFGGDNVDETRRNLRGYLENLSV